MFDVIQLQGYFYPACSIRSHSQNQVIDSIFPHVPMNSASWPACPLHEARIFVAETDTREVFPSSPTFPRSNKGSSRKESELAASRVTARRYRKETPLFSRESLASRDDQRTRGELVALGDKQKSDTQMVAQWLHRVQCHSNWRIRRKVAPREKWLRSSCLGIDPLEISLNLAQSWSRSLYCRFEKI